MTSDRKIEINFEHHWGGEDTWYLKAERWAKKQRFPIDHLALGFITWLKELWIDAKIEAVIKDVDKQAEEIRKQWEEEEKKPVIKSTPSEVEGLDIISISTFDK